MAGALIIVAFFLGSIPFGLLIGLAQGVDVRQHGSRNIGATNIGRVLGRGWGFACFGLDFLKGLAPTLAAGVLLGPEGRPGGLGLLGRLDTPAPLAWCWLAVVAGAVLGHMYSPWLGFRGGKGVATGFGALLGVWPALGAPALLALLVWAVVLKTTRYMGLASCLAAASLPISAALVGPLWLVLGLLGQAPEGVPPTPVDSPVQVVSWPYVAMSAVLAALVVYKHRGNIARMLAGTELRIGGPKGPSGPVSEAGGRGGPTT